MKKLISILVVVALLTVCLMFSVFASNEPQLVVDSVAADPGEEIVLDVTLVNNPGITNGKVTVDFDETGLELVDIDVTPAITAGFTMALANPDTRAMNFLTGGNNVTTSEFVLFTVKFRVKDDAAGDYQVSLTVNTFCNNNGKDVAVTVVAGTVTTNPGHVCEPVPVEGTPATYTSPGIKDHSKCACGKLYIDGVEVTEEDLVIPILREIVVDSATAAPGEEVVLNVSLVNNPGITNGKITVDYDDTVLELVEIDVTPAYAAGFTMALSNVPTRNMNFMSISGNISGDFTLFSVKFKVLETAADGDYPVSLTINKLVDDDNVAVDFTVVEGTVTVHACQAGETVIENVVEATCTTDGSHDEVTYCTTCGKELSRTNVVDGAIGHSYEAVITEPTCTEQGYTTHTCAKCGDSYVDSYVEANGHEMGQWYFYIASTAKVKGEMRCDCVHCDHYESEYLPYLGDVNGDDSVDTTDAKLIMQFDLGIIGETDLNLNVADVNGDGMVDTTDAKLIMQFDLGMVNDLPNSN